MLLYNLLADSSSHLDDIARAQHELAYSHHDILDLSNAHLSKYSVCCAANPPAAGNDTPCVFGSHPPRGTVKRLSS